MCAQRPSYTRPKIILFVIYAFSRISMLSNYCFFELCPI